VNERNKWATPVEFFEPLHEVFGFDLDVCAAPETAKVPHFFGEAEDGLAQDWSGYRCWMNPPYGLGLINHWVEKAARTTQRSGSNCLVVALLPARPGSGWFHEWVLPYAQLFFVRGRVQFIPPSEKVKKSSNPQDSIIAVYDSGGNDWENAMQSTELVAPLCLCGGH